MEGYIYTLSCPITNEIRYIGQTVNLKKRFSKHLCEADKVNTHVRCWVKGLKNKGLVPLIEILDNCQICDLDLFETMYISLFKGWGCNLTNIDVGGRVGRNRSLETRLKISNSLKGKKPSKETLLKRSNSSKETWKSEELRELKRIQSTELHRLGIIGNKGKPSPKKGKKFLGDKTKIIEARNNYIRNGGITNKKVIKDSDLLQIIKEYNEGVGRKKIQRKYGFSQRILDRIVLENNLTKRHASKSISKENLFQLYITESKTVKSISIEIGCSVANVERMLKKYCIRKNKKNK